MRKRFVKKKRVHGLTPVLAENRVLVEFANSSGNAVNALEAAFQKCMPRERIEGLVFDSLKDRVSDASPRRAGRLRSEIRLALEVLMSGDDEKIMSIFTRIDAGVPGRIHTLWTEEEASGLPFLLPEIRRIKLGGKPYRAVSSYPLHTSLRQLLYAMVRESIFADQAWRLRRCNGCQKIVVQQRKKPLWCGDACRAYYHNNKPERKNHYIKGKWYR